MSDKNLHVVVGLGATGFSCVRYLKNRGVEVAVTDSRLNPPFLSNLKEQYPDTPAALGAFDQSLLDAAETIILSPGISLHEKLIQREVNNKKRIIGDIELFALSAKVPVVAITGTNAKSTVTTLVGEMAKEAGFKVQVGGNLGTPALDLLQDGTDLFVLELSSFQLETTFSLRSKVASILNITPDHMDRYRTFAEYQEAKQRIYQHCEIAVANKDDPLSYCQRSHAKFYFTLNTPQANEFGLITKNNCTHLAFEDTPLIAVAELPNVGKHYYANVLASLAIGYGIGLPFESMFHALRHFKGLPHRCELIGECNEVQWVNDSKGTNVGATQAAIEGLGSEIAGKIILIAGGVGKNADFHPLFPSLSKYVRHVILIGEAAHDLNEMIANRLPTTFSTSLDEAIDTANKIAEPGDMVLLSPACASFDMFKHFAHRGEVFAQLVHDKILKSESND